MSGSDREATERVDYDSAAEAYSRTRTLAPNVLETWHDVLAPYFHPGVSTLLDVGAGTGQFARPLAQWFGVDVVALEPSSAMRRVGQHATRETRVCYLAGRCETVALTTASIDRAWLSAVVHHLTDLDLAASELRRVVKPGGLVLLRGFFRDVPLAPHLSAFPGIERSVSVFPSTQHVIDRLALHGMHLVTQFDVEEAHDLATASWESTLRELRVVDTMLRPLSDAEFEAGITSLRSVLASDQAAHTHRVTLRLVVCEVVSGSTRAGPAPGIRRCGSGQLASHVLVR
jgi:ubiquinone/menaquinone biosynthesis C-methylase UbiE